MLSLLAIAVLAWTCSAAPNPMITAAPVLARADMPLHCTTVFQNPLLESTWKEEHQCYTYTETVIQDGCRCAPAPDIMCLQYIEQTTMNLPCKTDCCLTTATVTEQFCPECNPMRCTISTETNLRYTGCELADRTIEGMPTVVVTPEPTLIDPLDIVDDDEDGNGTFPPPMGPYVPEGKASNY